MSVYISNGRIFTGEAILDGTAVRLENGLIAELIGAEDIPQNADIVDLDGHLLAPGFVDVQVNGGGGVLFNDAPDIATLKTIMAAHRRFGTTSMLPTLITDSFEVMQAAADAVSHALADGLAGIRGIHFEGPYLNTTRKGVHHEGFIREVDPDAVALLTRQDHGVVITTVAPEQVPAGFITGLTEAGVLVCAGHTAATYEQTIAGLAAGIRGFTHLFNAMSPLTSREPGVVGAALEDEDSWCGLIVDGHHVHDATLRVALAAKPRGKIMLVTDAMPTVGAPVSSFTLYGSEISAIDGRCTTADGTLAGSDLDMASAVRNTVRNIGLPVEEALRMASLYPAAFLRLDTRIGRIKAGYEADLVLLDDDLRVTRTWIAGQG